MADTEQKEQRESEHESESEAPENAEWLFEGSSGDEPELSEQESDEDNPINLAELSDSEDDEGPLIRIGEIPMSYYDDENHRGYDIDGNRVIVKGRGDNIDLFLLKKDKDAVKRTLYDPLNDREVRLTDDDLKLINRIRHGKTAGKLFQPAIRPIKLQETAFPSNTPKSSFLPSKHVKNKVLRMLKAVRNGWLRLDDYDKEEEEQFFDIWDGDFRLKRTILSAPKTALPGHAESYNPPEEYMFDDKEKKTYEEDPSEKPYNFDPVKHKTMRHTGAYDQAVEERFERCLDLYLCTRQKKMKLDIDPDSLLPKLPNPSDLKPFPTFLGLEYTGHTEKVRALCVSKNGQWLVTGSDDCTVRVWEVSTGRCMRVFQFEKPIQHLRLNPVHPVLAVVLDNQAVMLPDPIFGNVEAYREFSKAQAEEQTFTTWAGTSVKNSCKHGPSETECILITLASEMPIYRLAWHPRGDYFATIRVQHQSSSLLVHRLSAKTSQQPFANPLGEPQDVHFHPKRPHLILVTKMWIRIYNLQSQTLFKKMRTTSQHIAKIAVHPTGDHFLIGCYDSHVFWYDVDMTSKPFQNLKYHKRGVRAVDFHPRLPLAATASDDGSMHIFHAKVYNNYMTDPLIVPVKILRAHNVENGVGVLDCVFHPTQPWVFSSGMSGKVKLFM